MKFLVSKSKVVPVLNKVSRREPTD